MFVNIGSLLAVTGVVYVQEAVSWSVGFAIPAAAMGAAMAECTPIRGHSLTQTGPQPSAMNELRRHTAAE